MGGGRPKDIIPIGNQEESELLFFFPSLLFNFERESFVDLGREGF